MSFGFQNIGHFFAVTFSDISKGAKAVEKALVKVGAAEATVEAITALVYPPAVLIERAAFSVLGKVAGAAHDAQPAADASGLNVTFTAVEVADIRALIAIVKGDIALLKSPTAVVVK